MLFYYQKEKNLATARLNSSYGLVGFLSVTVKGTPSTGTHANLNNLAIDVNFVFLKVNAPSATSRTDAVAAVITAHRAFSTDWANSGHVFYLVIRDKTL